MSERGKGLSTETWIFIDLMVRTPFFSLKHLIMQKLIANCATKVLNLLMLLEVEKIFAISKLCCSFFFFSFLNGNQSLFSDI